MMSLVFKLLLNPCLLLLIFVVQGEFLNRNVLYSASIQINQ